MYSIVETGGFQYKVELGKTYPKPIVDHAKARERALEAFRKTKTGQE